MRGLTQKDLDVLEFIKQYMLENKVTPTIKDINSFFGLKSPSYTHERLERLADAGLLIRIKDHSHRYIVKGMEYREVEK